MPDVQVVPFSREYDRSAFDCGNPNLNDFLTKYASQYEKRGSGRTYLAIDPHKKVLGYYTLASASIPAGEVPESLVKLLGKHPIPVILLGRLAVAIEMQGKGVGKFLLQDALHRSVSVSQQIGVYAVIVKAIDNTAKHFYEKYGFTQVPPDPLQLFLPISSIP
jgi:predicted GNAT family N-acyltransferase